MEGLIEACERSEIFKEEINFIISTSGLNRINFCKMKKIFLILFVALIYEVKVSTRTTINLWVDLSRKSRIMRTYLNHPSSLKRLCKIFHSNVIYLSGISRNRKINDWLNFSLDRNNKWISWFSGHVSHVRLSRFML